MMEFLSNATWSPYLVGVGIGIVSWLAFLFSKLKQRVLNVGSFGDKTLIDVLPVRNPWVVIVPVAILIVAFLVVLEMEGF